MADFNSKYSGEEVEALLDQVASGGGEGDVYVTEFTFEQIISNGTAVNVSSELVSAIYNKKIIVIPSSRGQNYIAANTLSSPSDSPVNIRMQIVTGAYVYDVILMAKGPAPQTVPTKVTNRPLLSGTLNTINGASIAAGADMQLVSSISLNGKTYTPSKGAVNLGEIEVDEVKFANDLTGVVEATPEMFTYRPSAGDKSVRDESAVIRRIKGNTSVWGQYVRNGDFAEGTRYSSGVNTTLSNNDDGSINIVNKGSDSDGISQSFLLPIPAKHKVLIVMDYKRSSTAVSHVVFYLTKSGSGIYDRSYIYSVSSDSRRVDSAILETTNDADLILVYPFIKGAAGEYTTMYSYMAIDLTAIFGAGNEPTTYEEFRQYYPDAYYPYCLPEVRSMRASGIETIGFNQWDEQWENGSFNTADGTNISNNQIRCKNLIRIFPNTYYSLSIGDKNLGIWAMFYDNNQNILQPVNLNSSVSSNCLYISPSGNRNVFLTPENASWMKFYTPSEYGSTTYKGDICINLSHSGVRNGEYKPYEKNTLLLPEIAKYFPNGMHGIGDVYDEINEEMAIQRCDVRAYEEGDENNAEVKTDKITTVYKLSESIHTPIDELLQLDYKVDDFGTEKMLSDAPSSPFKADIVYQFNAEGRIRDNSRNIEKLEKLVKQPSDWLEDNPSSPAYIKNKPTMPTQIATATQIEEYSVTDGSQSLSPNIMYELSFGIGQETEFVMPNIVQASNSTYDNRWMLRLPSISRSEVLTYPYTINWKDGIAPNFTSGCTLEIYLKMTGMRTIIGEWKIYK